MADLLELFRERVAICIHEGKMTELNAIRLAYSEIKRMTSDVPQEIKTALRDAVNGALHEQQ